MNGMIVSARTTLACALVLLVACAARADDVDRATIERIASAVERVLGTERRFEATVVRRIFMGRDATTALRPDRDPPGVEDRSLVRVLALDHAAVVGDRSLFVDVYFRGVRYGANLAGGDAMVERASNDRALFGLALLAQSALFVPLEWNEPLAAALRESLPIALESDGTVVTYRFRFAGEQRTLDAMRERAQAGGHAVGDAWPRSITVDLADPPRILGWSRDVPRRGLGQPFEPDRWSVDEWTELDGLPLPKRIRRETRTHPDEDGVSAPYLQITEFERIVALPADCAPSRPLPAGIRVEGQGIRFTVGSAEVTRDGETLRLAKPLWYLPTREELDELLKQQVHLPTPFSLREKVPRSGG